MQKYCFEDSGLLIRPAASSLELINEGKAMNHCVGTYADRYAKGDTNIFVIRKSSEPDKPYFTVEIKQERIVQCRGNEKCSPDEKVTTFIDAFTERKLNNKNSKAKIQRPVPA